MGGERYYTYTKNNVRFFVLDTDYIDPKQLQWVEQELRNSRLGLEDFLLPPPAVFQWRRHGSEVDLRTVLEPLFLKYGVNVVYAGHDHIYERLTPQKGIYHFVSGSAGQLRKGDLKRSATTAAGFDADQSFMINEIAGDDLSLPGDLANRQDRGCRGHSSAAETRTGLRRSSKGGFRPGPRGTSVPGSARPGDEARQPFPIPREADAHADVRQPRRSDRGRQRADEIDPIEQILHADKHIHVAAEAARHREIDHAGNRVIRGPWKRNSPRRPARAPESRARSDRRRTAGR